MAFIGLGIDIPSLYQDDPKIHDEAQHALPPTHAPLAPRSLGVRGHFVNAPSSKLPTTLYTRNPATNPLILLPQSPLLELPLAHHNPALHLRAMKKRSIANRDFGTSGDAGLEPFHGVMSSPHGVETPESPTVMSSPSVPSSPVVAEAPAASNHPLFATSIALSVFLGLILLGIGGWAGVRYRRKRQLRLRDYAKDIESSPKPSDLEVFSASNVVEKPLRPRNSSVSSTRPKSIVSQSGFYDSRRVSFADYPVHTDSMMNLHERIYGEEDQVTIARSRMRSSTMSTIERALASSRPPSFMSLVSTLDPIEEEETCSLRSSTSSHQRRASTPVTRVRKEERPASLASMSTSSSAYATASARSSISDLTTLSTISCLSSFPETPRTEQRTSPSEAQPEHMTPSKATWRCDRKLRAQSQTVVSVKQIDLLRTAVGRTMSLQPSKQVVAALQEMTEVESMNVLQELIRGRDELMFNTSWSDSAFVEQMDDEVEEEGDETLVDDPEDIIRPENGMKKVLFDLSDDTAPNRSTDIVTSSPVTRSRSFPSKLLARPKSSGPSPNARRSEVISDGYLKHTLRALRGEEDTMPPMPGSFFHPQCDADDGAEDDMRDGRRDSSSSTCTEISAASDTSDNAEEIVASRDWRYSLESQEFDAYYLHLVDGFGLETGSDDELATSSDAHLPHIRVTSH